MLKAKNLKKTFFQPTKCEILKEISLEVHPGETVAIMGSSGVGKSTLLHILGTLEKPDSGTLMIAGYPALKNIPLIRNQHIGFIFQSFFLIENLSLLQNVLMPAKIARKSTLKGSLAYQRALELLERLSLLDRKDHLAKTLSGGEKQRACIARALINDPSIIFADEPTGNLDQATSKTIQTLLIESVKKEGKSLILVTHDQEFANLCDRIYHLYDGQLFTQKLSSLK